MPGSVPDAEKPSCEGCIAACSSHRQPALSQTANLIWSDDAIPIEPFRPIVILLFRAVTLRRAEN